MGVGVRGWLMARFSPHKLLAPFSEHLAVLTLPLLSCDLHLASELPHLLHYNGACHSKFGLLRSALCLALALH